MPYSVLIISDLVKDVQAKNLSRISLTSITELKLLMYLEVTIDIDLKAVDR